MEARTCTLCIASLSVVGRLSSLFTKVLDPFMSEVGIYSTGCTIKTQIEMRTSASGIILSPCPQCFPFQPPLWLIWIWGHVFTCMGTLGPNSSYDIDVLCWLKARIFTLNIQFYSFTYWSRSLLKVVFKLSCFKTMNTGYSYFLRKNTTRWQLTGGNF